MNDLTGPDERASDTAVPLMRVEDAVLEEARLAVGPLVSGGKARKQRELYQPATHKGERWCHENRAHIGNGLER